MVDAIQTFERTFVAVVFGLVFLMVLIAVYDYQSK